MKRILMVPLGILAAVGILMMAGCGTPVNPMPKIEVTNISDAPPGGSASFTINVYGPDIYIYSSVDAVTTTPPGTKVTNSPVQRSIQAYHSQPNTGNVPYTYNVTVTPLGGTAGTEDAVDRTYYYYTVPGNVKGTFPVSFRIFY